MCELLQFNKNNINITATGVETVSEHSSWYRCKQKTEDTFELAAAKMVHPMKQMCLEPAE